MIFVYRSSYEMQVIMDLITDLFFKKSTQFIDTYKNWEICKEYYFQGKPILFYLRTYSQFIIQYFMKFSRLIEQYGNVPVPDSLRKWAAVYQ